MFEGQLAEELLGPYAVGAGGLDEHDHLPRLDLAVHKLLSHADRLLPPRKESSAAGIAWVHTGSPASWLSFKGTSLEEEFLGNVLDFLKGQTALCHFSLV